MKIALCVSGQPRGLATAFQYVKKNLLDKHDVTVFAHLWQDSTKDLAPLWMYEPKKFELEQPMNPDLSKYTRVPPPQPNWKVKNPALSTYAQPLDNQPAHLASLEYVPHLALPFYPWGQSDISPRLKGNFEGGEHAARMCLQAGTQMSWWPPLERGGYPRA